MIKPAVPVHPGSRQGVAASQEGGSKSGGQLPPAAVGPSTCCSATTPPTSSPGPGLPARRAVSTRSTVAAAMTGFTGSMAEIGSTGARAATRSMEERGMTS